MKPKRIIFWILFGILAYNAFGYVRMHTRGDVIVYKQFASSVRSGDGYDVGRNSMGDVSQRVLAAQSDRKSYFKDLKPLFTYYKIKGRRVSEDGNNAYLRAEQVTRVNFEGQDKLLGNHWVRIPHNVQLVRQNNTWKVVQFDDPAMTP